MNISGSLFPSTFCLCFFFFFEGEKCKFSLEFFILFRSNHFNYNSNEPLGKKVIVPEENRRL